MTVIDCDVLVVGAGATGLFTAHECRSLGAKVVLVGDARPNSGTSAAGAMLGCFGEVVNSTLETEPGRARFEVHLAAHKRWPTILAELSPFAGAPLVRSSDTTVIHNAIGGASDSSNFEALVRALNLHREDYTADPDLVELSPVATHRPLQAVGLLHEPSIDAAALVQALEARNAANGVVRLADAVSELVVGRDRVAGARLAGGDEVRANTVFVATGAFGGPLLERAQAGVQPVLSGSGVAIVAHRVIGEAAQRAYRTVVRAGSCGLHVLPLGDGREYIGATNVVFGEPEDRAHLGVVKFLVEAACQQIHTDLAYSRVDEIRVGNRPMTLDGWPLWGPASVEGLWVLTGGYRDGLHAAPEVASTAAQAALSSGAGFSQWFAPTREPTSLRSVDSSIDEFVDQQVASAFETGLVTTPFLSADRIAATFRTDATHWFAQSKVACGIPTDLLAFVLLSRKHARDVDAVMPWIRRFRSP